MRFFIIKNMMIIIHSKSELKNNKNKKKKLFLKKNKFENNNVIDIFRNKFINEFLIESLTIKKDKIEIIVNSNMKKILKEFHK